MRKIVVEIDCHELYCSYFSLFHCKRMVTKVKPGIFNSGKYSCAEFKCELETTERYNIPLRCPQCLAAEIKKRGGVKGFLCPLCNGEMIPERWQCEDGAWVFGWGCDCDEETREGLNELFIHSQAAQESAVEDICKELKEMSNKEGKCPQKTK